MQDLNKEINKLEDLISIWFTEYSKHTFVSERAARILLGISSTTIRELIKRKKINYICLDGKIHIPFNMQYVLQKNTVVNLDALEKAAHENDPDDNPFVVR